MAGFICDLCGGQITMQANKTGVCKECGMEYDLEAIRAKMGAASKPVSTPAPVASVAVQSSDEVDREALITYLNDVRVMETVISKDTAFSQKLAEKEQQLIFTKVAPSPPYKPISVEEAHSKWKSDNKRLLILDILLIPLCGAGLFFLLSHYLGWIELKKKVIQEYEIYEEKNKVYLAQKAEYDKEKSRSERNLLRQRPELRKHRTAAGAEIASYKKMLQTAYDANIIPVQFRNIQGVYYLYDYLSTSNQTLSEALMQCNLEAIKQKLDKMIQLQSEQIVQQAVTNAKLGKIYEVSEATMNNTAVAAKYAQIAAVNSEVTKKLASSSLAYQKADFWLK